MQSTTSPNEEWMNICSRFNSSKYDELELQKSRGTGNTVVGKVDGLLWDYWGKGCQITGIYRSLAYVCSLVQHMQIPTVV